MYSEKSFFRHFLQILLDTFEIWTLKKPFSLRKQNDYFAYK